MAEVGNASWKRDGKKLALVDACWDDIASQFIQNKDLDDILKNKLKSTGKGKTQRVQMARELTAQRKRAERYAEVAQNEDMLEIQGREATNPNFWEAGMMYIVDPNETLKYIHLK